jgi:PGDYG protein
LGTEPVSVYRSSGTRGFSPRIAGDPRRVEARKLEFVVRVRFTSSACTIQTHEGTVHARPGDAILLGMKNEQWRVSIERFPEKYRPLPPTLAGEPGRYVSLRIRVMAVQMNEPFEVLLADGVSRLRGQGGDWLVDYGDGSLGIVAADMFAKTYEILG